MHRFLWIPCVCVWRQWNPACEWRTPPVTIKTTIQSGNYRMSVQWISIAEIINHKEYLKQGLISWKSITFSFKRLVILNLEYQNTWAWSTHDYTNSLQQHYCVPVHLDFCLRVIKTKMSWFLNSSRSMNWHKNNAIPRLIAKHPLVFHHQIWLTVTWQHNTYKHKTLTISDNKKEENR